MRCECRGSPRRHAKDIAQKELIRVLDDAAVEWYGIDSPPIGQVLAPNVPQVVAHESVADAVFQADDGRIVHLEFQSTPEPDLYRCLGYASALASGHRALVQVVVVYLSGRQPASVTLDAYSIRFTVEAVLIGSRDGEAAEERLRRLVTSGSEWTAADLLDLAYWPFMQHPRKTQSARAASAVKTAAAPAGLGRDGAGGGAHHSLYLLRT